MADDEKKQGRIAYINASQSGDGSLYGKLNWDGEQFRITHIEHDGPAYIADVQCKNGKTWTDKAGATHDSYENIGAMRWNTEKGDGEFVTETMGQVVKYPFTNSIETTAFGPTRVLRFKTPSTNKFRTMFKDAMEVVDEQPAGTEPINDDLPY